MEVVVVVVVAAVVYLRNLILSYLFVAFRGIRIVKILQLVVDMTVPCGRMGGRVSKA